ncbi:MAG: 1-acyl-sn-glycerol-3-phosphate acyltransferase [Actinomycetota bacterium]|nr:1-acyl-sn-glycerol-3-phosphate acyltransferase [Actinomycetota bacterium]
MDFTYWLAKSIVKPWMSWFRWSIEGLERIPDHGPAILAFNHIAFLDPFAAAYAVDLAGRRPRFLAKAELFDDPRISWILKGCGQIPVQRGTAQAPMALDTALRALERGEVIVIFPEGTITSDPDLNPMEAKTGMARLALASGIDVTPCGLWGTANIWPKDFATRWWPPKQDIMVRVGQPMKMTGDPSSTDDWRRCGEIVMGEIARLVASLRPAVPDRRRTRKRAA